MPFAGEENLITNADISLLGVVAETLNDVAMATITASRGAGIDAVLSFLGKRAKRPVTWVDSVLARAMVWKTVQYCLLNRGLSDVDEQVLIDHMKEIDPWLLLVSKGEVEPAFIDSTSAIDEMGSLSGSSATSDAWARADIAARMRCC